MRISRPSCCLPFAFGRPRRTGPSGDVTDTQSLRSIQARYGPDDLALLTPAERERFCDEDPWLAWELLYRKEPELYERLIAGEHIHPDVLAWLPSRVDRCVE